MQIRAIQPAQPTPLITLKNINVVFEQKTALRDINLSIYPNSIITIVGPNGGGKSTLLKTLLKLQTPTSGEVIYSANVRIGYVPQKIHLDHSLPMTVERFLALKKGVKTQEISIALEQLSIIHLRKNNMQKLSGGEMQRVLLARAILNKPNLLVLDEPTQGVDINGQAELYQLIHRTQQALNCAVLMVSHDLHIVMADSKEVLCINQHIRCAGTPESLSNDPTFIRLLFPALLTGLLLSLITAPLGAFVVWRKMAYFGDTLSHSALLGVALGIFLQINPYVAIVILTIILAVLMVWLESNTQFSVDTLLGIIAHSCLSLGVVTVGLLKNVRVDLMSYLFGDLLAINFNDLPYIGAGVVIVLGTLLYFWQALLSTTVSPELAQVEGINIKKMRFILMILTALTIALSMKFVGALIITSLLIIPAATARRFAKTPEQMVFIAILISMLSIVGGLFLSAFYDTAAGPSVVICSAFLFLLSLLKKEYL